MTTFFNLTEKSDDTYVATIMGQIGSFMDDIMFDGNTLDTSIKAELDSIPSGVKNLQLRINSPGGSVSTGVSIYNQLINSGLNVTTLNLGECSSIASIIFLSGTTRVQPDGAFALIHEPAHEVRQNVTEARKNLKQLEAVNESIKEIYLKHLNISEEELDVMMEEETILTSEHALKIGFSNSKTLPSEVTAPSPETMSSRVDVTKGFIKDQKEAFIAKRDIINNEESSMSDKEKLAAALEEKVQLEAKVENLTAMKATLENDFKAYKEKNAEVDVVAITAEARKEAVAEIKQFDEIKAQATKVGFKANAESPTQLMQAVLVEGGISEDKATVFKDEALVEMFNFVVSNKVNKEADDEFQALADDKSGEGDVEMKTPVNFWDDMKEGVK
ncbi:ATP-dependent Clp protease proteolytic subunit [bacterium]|nr:ATP-dependent Clp protease proteolytic subunit [bacterium]